MTKRFRMIAGPLCEWLAAKNAKDAKRWESV